MGTLTDRLNNPDYKSWLKSGLILKHLKSGLEEYLEHESQSMHRRVLSSMQQGLPTGTPPTCTECNNTLAKCRHWRCRTHNICTDLRDKLDSEHIRGKGNLVLGNSDVSLWTNPAKSWEIAKCFMSNGYKNKYSARETDCTGLLGIIINCKTIRDKFSPALIQPANVFEKVREIRNKVMHSPDLTSSTHDVNDLVQKSLEILEDPSTLLTKPAAIDAAIKIKEIHTVQVSISREDEMQVLTNAVKALEVGQAEHEENLNVMLEEHKSAVGDQIQTQCFNIENKTKSQIDDLKATLEEKENKIKQIESLLDLEQIHLKKVDTILKSVSIVIESNKELAARDIRTNMEVVINNNSKLHELIIGNRQWMDKEIRDMKANQESILKTLSRLHSEQTNTKQRVDDLESRQSETQAKMNEFGQIVTEAAATNTVRQNIIANTKAHLETHARNKCYTHTSAVQTVLDKLSEKHVVIITGKAGVGKTTAILEVMSRISDGYLTSKSMDMAIIDEAGNWDTVVNCNDKMLVFLDDPFGRTNLDQNSYDKWEKKFNQVFSCVEKGNLYVVLGIRLNIFDELRNSVRKYTLFDDKNVINLSAQEYELSENEKHIMVKRYTQLYSRHINRHDTLEIVSTNPYYGFPQTCFLFFKETSFFKLGVGFFKHPDASLRKEIEHLRTSNDDTQKWQYCVLVYILLYKTINLHNLDMGKLQNICQHVKMADIQRCDMEEATKSLSGIYLMESQGVYEFKHTTILEAVFFSFGKLAPATVIKNCSAQLLNELIKAEKYKLKEHEVILRMRLSDLQVLIERLVNTLPFTDERGAILELVDKVCMDAKFDDIVSALSSSPSEICSFFIACRFGKSRLVKQMLTRNGYLKSWYNRILLSKRNCCVLSPSVVIHCLYQAVLQGHFSTVKAILKYDMKLAACTYGRKQECFSMIHTAVLGNHLSIVRYLCKVYPHFTNGTHDTMRLLHHCLVNDFYDILETLIKTDSEIVGITDENGCSLILVAAQLKRKAIVTLLYQYKPDAKGYCQLGKTLLHYCVKNDWYDILETLIKDDLALVNLTGTTGEPIICYAAEIKKLDMVAFLYKYKPDITCCDRFGKTLLHYCVEHDWYEILEKLINDNPKLVNLTNEKGETLIAYAARLEKPSMVMSLYKLKADIKLYETCGVNVLRYCLLNDWVDVFEIIFKDDPTLVSLTDKYGVSLCFAARHKRKHLFKRLIECKADVHRYDRQGQTCMHYCVDNDWLDILEFLIEADPSLVNLTNENGESLICYAARKKREVIVKLLHEHNADLTGSDRFGKTLLHYCVGNNWTDILDTLVEFDPTLVNITGENGDPLICFAAEWKIKDIVIYLYEHNADVKRSDRFGKTLFHYCVDNDWLDVLRILVESDSKSVDLIDDDGDSLICYAAAYNHKDMVTFLYDRKADVKTFDFEGKSLLHYCIDNEWWDVFETVIKDDHTLVNLIDKYGVSLSSYTAKHKRKDLFMSMLVYTSDVHRYDREGQTCLHYCVDNDWLDMLEFLIEADPTLVNLTNEKGESLICYAARKKRELIVKLLFEHNADVTLSDRFGKTIIHYFVDNNWYDELTTLIKEDPTLVNLTDRNGDPLICYAAKKKKQHTVRFLYEHHTKEKLSDRLVKTLLHYCVSNDWSDFLVDTLIKNDTALLNLCICYAIVQQNKNLVKVLYDCDPNSKRDPLRYYGVDDDWCDELKTLVQADSTLVNTSICYAAAQNEKAMVMCLYGHISKVETLDFNGKTLLHYCIDNGWFDVFNALIRDDPTRVNVRDINGESLRCYALKRNMSGIVSCLYKYEGYLIPGEQYQH